MTFVRAVKADLMYTSLGFWFIGLLGSRRGRLILFKFLKRSWRLILAAIFTLSLTLNVAGFMGAALWKGASIVWEEATGLRSSVTTHAATVQELTNERQRLQKANADLDNRNTKLQSDLNEALDKVTNERRLAESKSKSVAKKVSETTNRMARRLSLSAGRNVVSMPAEAIPYIGADVIVGVTTMELYDLCETMKDLEVLNLAFNPDDVLSEDRKTVCALEIPTKGEVMDAVANAPKASWTAAKIFVTDLPEVDFEATWASTIEGAVGLGD
jgi:Skp family chaperone for outer membrane proteins